MFDSVPSDAVGYVASAYLFFLLLVLVYIAILGAKFQRINRELAELINELEAEDEPEAEEKASAGAPPADAAVREETSV